MKDYKARNEEIIQLVAEDNINRAIGRLFDFVRDFCSDHNLQSESLIISANHKKLMREERQNLIDYNTANQIRSRIINQILSICKEVCLQLEKEKETKPESNDNTFQPQEEDLTSDPPITLKPNVKSFENSIENGTGLETEKTGFKSNVICKISALQKEYIKTGFKLKNIDLTININEITAVVGENGNGKTTLFRVLSGT